MAARIEAFLPEIEAREEAMLLRALYHSGHGTRFRAAYRRAERAGMLRPDWRWRRRYAASFLSPGPR